MFTHEGSLTAFLKFEGITPSLVIAPCCELKTGPAVRPRVFTLARACFDSFVRDTSAVSAFPLLLFVGHLELLPFEVRLARQIFRVRADTRPFPPAVANWRRLTCSYRSDSVTTGGPVALRARAAQLDAGR